jgi:hypothetical protein
MILHASFTVDTPRDAALTLAELIGGEAIPLEGFSPGAWMALAGDDHGTLVQFLRRGVEFHHVPGETVVHRQGEPRRESGFHILLETPHDTPRIFALSAARGCHAQLAQHGPLELIELWIDGSLLIELATPAMAAAYRAASSPEAVRTMVALSDAPLPARPSRPEATTRGSPA